VVLDILVQSRRDAKAAKRLLRTLLKKQGIAPRVMITDKLASYAATKRAVMPSVEHRQHKGFSIRPISVKRFRSVRLHDMTVPRALASLRNQHDGSSTMGSEE
jgi:transposase-like protein